MVISRLQGVRDAGGLLTYIKDVEAHTEGFERVENIAVKGCTPSTARTAFRSVLKHFGKEGNVQAQSVVVSFSERELDPSEDNSEAVLAVLRHVAEKQFEGHQYVAVAQRDGEGGKWHGHLAVCNVHPETGKSIRGEAKTWQTLSKNVDEACRLYGIENENEGKDRTLTKTNNIKHVKMREAGKYVWLDDLKERIEECTNDTDILSIDEFEKRMSERFGVDVRRRGKENKMSYAFEDKDGKKRTVRQSRLGTLYGYEGISTLIAENKALDEREKEVADKEEQVKAERLRLKAENDYAQQLRDELKQYDPSELEVAKAGVALYNWVIDTPESLERTTVIRGVQASQKLDETMKQRMRKVASVKVTRERLNEKEHHDEFEL